MTTPDNVVRRTLPVDEHKPLWLVQGPLEGHELPAGCRVTQVPFVFLETCVWLGGLAEKIKQQQKRPN